MAMCLGGGFGQMSGGLQDASETRQPAVPQAGAVADAAGIWQSFLGRGYRRIRGNHYRAYVLVHFGIASCVLDI